MPIGSPSGLKKNIPDYPDKQYDVFYSGQVNHERREELVKVLNNMQNTLSNATGGFTQGFPLKEYYQKMSQSKVCPSPAGALTIDSFRFYEAIEMLSLPIADAKSSLGQIVGFWELVFGESFPFEQVTNWNQLEKLLPRLLKNYPNDMHQVVSWWILYKRNFRNKIMEQIYAN